MNFLTNNDININCKNVRLEGNTKGQGNTSKTQKSAKTSALSVCEASLGVFSVPNEPTSERQSQFSPISGHRLNIKAQENATQKIETTVQSFFS